VIGLGNTPNWPASWLRNAIVLLILVGIGFVTANGVSKATITVHVSETDEVTTTPHIRQPVRIVVSGSDIVSGNDYRILRAYATETALASVTDAITVISAVDVVTATTNGRLTWTGAWGDWDAKYEEDEEDDFTETVYAGLFAMRLFVQSSAATVPNDLAGLEATMGSSEQLLPGKNHLTGTVQYGGDAYQQGTFVAGQELEVTGEGWGTPTPPSADRDVQVQALAVAGDLSETDVHLRFWDAYYATTEITGYLFAASGSISGSDAFPGGEGAGVIFFDTTSLSFTEGSGYGFEGTSVPYVDPSATDTEISAWIFHYEVEYDPEPRIVTIGSSVGTASLRPASPEPAIEEQPQAVTALERASATFSVTATGSGSLTYQWQTARNTTSDWRDVAGATEVTWTKTDVARSDDGLQVRVRVANTEAGKGSAFSTSDATVLTVTPVSPLPVLVTQPADVSTVAGNAATFTVVATGLHPLSYQWQRASADTWSDVDGGTDATLTVDSVSLTEDAARYRVLVTQSEPNVLPATITSTEATLTVYASDAPSRSRAFPANHGVWLVFEPTLRPGDPIVNYAVQLKDGEWIAFEPPTTTPPLRIDGFLNGETFQIRVRAIYASGGVSEPSEWMTFTPTVVTAPTLTFELPAGLPTFDATRTAETVTFDAIVSVANEGSDPMAELWLDVSSLEDGVRITGISPEEGFGTIEAFGDLWLWTGLNLPPDTTTQLTLTVTVQEATP